MPYFRYQGSDVFYMEDGAGAPCIFLHGNTASSRMFEPILPLYTSHMRAIRMDFLGNGRSERVSAFPDELWIDQGHQVVTLCKALDCGKVDLIGTSGGAYAAINAALERPDLFHRVVADSFDGSTLPTGFGEGILRERRKAKCDELARGFYAWCQGEDWEPVVDLDTQALVNYERKGLRLFRRPIEDIQVPLLITVSRQDEMLSNDMETECWRLQEQNPNIHSRIYDTGGHPLILTRADELAGEIIPFLRV